MKLHTPSGGTNFLQETEAHHRSQSAHVLARLGLAESATALFCQPLFATSSLFNQKKIHDYGSS